ncbi:MAG TPA: HAMP domain-containing sensor histidine kinase [Flavobacteriales bacterium]
MLRRPFLLALAMLAGAGAALLRGPDENSRLTQAAQELQERVRSAQAQLELHTLQLASRASQASGEELWNIPPADPTEAMLVLREGRAVLWSGQAPTHGPDLDTVHAAHLRLADGLYLHAIVSTAGTHVHGVRRVWYEPPFENRYLTRHFEEGFRTGDGLQAALEPGMGPVVRDASGEVMFRLAVDPLNGDGPVPLARLALAVLSAVCALAALWLTAAARRGPAVALLLFIAPVVGLRILSLSLPTWPVLGALPLFDPSFFGASFLMPSLGDLALGSGLLLCIASFLHSTLLRSRPPRRATMTAAALFALLFLGAAELNNVLISLVRDSSVSLDLFHIQGFNAFSWTAMGCIALLLLTWMVFADAFLRWCALPIGTVLVLLASGTAITLVIYHMNGVYDTLLSCWPATVIALILLARSERLRFLSALLLVAAPALFTAHVLNRETLKRLDSERATLAENVIAGEDPVIELLFQEASIAIGNDPDLQDLLLPDTVRSERRALTTPCSSTDLDRLVRQAFFNGYWDRYDVRLHLFQQDGTMLCSTSSDAPPSQEQFRARFQQGVPTAGDTALRSVQRPGESALYLGVVPLRDPRSHTLMVELKPRLMPDGLGFPELLLAGDRFANDRQQHYATARYERGALTESTGSYAFPVRWSDAIPSDGARRVDRGYDLLAYGDQRGIMVVLGIRIPSALDHFTTFSYLFTLFALLGGLLLLLRNLLGTPRAPRFGLGAKLRTGILLFAATSLVLFAIGTRNALDTRSEQRSTRAMKDRSRGVITELRQTLHAEGGLTPSMTPYLDHLLTRFSNVFYTDLSLYAPDGSLLATSREQVFNSGLLARRMDPVAYREVAVLGRSSFTQEERIGTARFRASYMPFRNDRGETLAYLAMPYFARQTEADQERTAGYVAVVNLFTLLFVLSGIAAALITQWTTRPLLALRKGLERIALGTRNEPIPYAGRDELGELVQVYNRKVEELRESAERLARSERESAWREMARQVAHEIKNPLTPMKLSIQHFQHTWTPDLPDARERLDRFSRNLVEQIDVLSRIAGEFSHFAQMPPAHPVLLDPAEVARTAVELFTSTPNVTVVFEGGQQLTVLADREHLLRILNNLIKNALQSIPDDRQGQVQVSLRQENNEAVIEVRDNGTGIPEAIRDRLFTPSFTTKSSGMGLGLAMVKRMVEHAGGRVWFTSEEGIGTRFFVTLPLHTRPVHLPNPDHPIR